MPLRDISAKWKSFGWKLMQVDGHSMHQLVLALHLAKLKRLNLPQVILAQTIKGKGVSFMENDNSWHQKAITDDEMKIAEKELRGKIL